jgi:hypothetical protein
VLSKDQIKAINLARQILRDLENTAMSDPRFSRGKLSEACTTAESALFNVLLIAKHWAEEEISDEELYSTEKKEVIS